MSERSAIDEAQAELEAQEPKVRERMSNEIVQATKHLKWIPNPGPQMDAYMSEADVLLFGGEPGGGKSDLVLGLAFDRHERSLVMRRQYTHLSGLTDRAVAINGSRNGYNGSPPPSFRHARGVIQFGAAQNVGDEQDFQGQARDFLGIDEATQFAEQQVRMLMGWVRTSNKKQRTRTVLATNPPLTSEGLWVIKMFAPWLDDTFPNPARAAELRWVVTDGDDGDRWVEGPGEYLLKDGRRVRATSRTYIPSSMKDNPDYARTGYQATLDALPEQIRSILMGGFKASFKDAPDQIIPTAWIRAAQERWTPRAPFDVPMCAMGVDCSGGGDDPLVIAMRHDGWFAPLTEIPGKQIPKDSIGSYTASQVIVHRRDRALPVIDLGGGYGGACFEALKANDVEVRGYKGAERSTRRTKDKQLGFFNVRSQALWQFREALDPDQPGGSPIALPEDPVLVADLTAPTLDLSFRGIKAESKEDVCKRLGRSTNRGDAVIMAWYDGPKAVTHGGQWREEYTRGRRVPKVVMNRRYHHHG